MHYHVHKCWEKAARLFQRSQLKAHALKDSYLYSTHIHVPTHMHTQRILNENEISLADIRSVKRLLLHSVSKENALILVQC